MGGRVERKMAMAGAMESNPGEDKTPGALTFNLNENPVPKGDEPVPAVPRGAIPRITRLMALAIKFEGLIEDGLVRDFADLARLGSVTRARITQVMNLLYLAPDIQEAILELPKTVRGRDPINETRMRRIVREMDWERQREMWRGLSE